MPKIGARRRSLLRLGAALGVAAALAAGLTVPSTSIRPPRARAAVNPINHIVFIQKENRSFDHYFGRFPGVNGSTTFDCYHLNDPSIVDTASLLAAPDPMPQDVAHANSTFYKAYHDGKMDGFCHENGAITPGGQDIADTQFRETGIPNYWAYARTYGLGDKMFASWRGASFANNVFAVAAQTGRYSPSLNRRAIYGNPNDPTPGTATTWGCDNGEGTFVDMMNLKGGLSQVFPCYTFDSIPKLLERHGHTWGYYSDPKDTQWVHSGIAAIRNLRCADTDTPPCTDANPEWDNHIHMGRDLVPDALSGNLPDVTWFLPKQNEHPPKSACAGENATVEAINAIMSGPDWKHTAIVIWWDEWGGFHDHAKPPTAIGKDDGIRGINKLVSYGFRVPLLVISPWVKKGSSPAGGLAPSGHGYVSSKFYSMASVARFVEWAFGMPDINAADDLTNYVSREPKPGNLSDFFDITDATPQHGKLLLDQRDCTALSPAQRAYIATWNPD
jgi:phospholipase C